MVSLILFLASFGPVSTSYGFSFWLVGFPSAVWGISFGELVGTWTLYFVVEWSHGVSHSLSCLVWPCVHKLVQYRYVRTMVRTLLKITTPDFVNYVTRSDKVKSLD
jgi:hypothetical protein